MNIVAGSTRSAMTAVSVMNCSCTTVNRSGRANPWRTSACSGATVIGLVFWINIALTGGQDAPDLGLVEHAYRRVDRVVRFDDGLVEFPDRIIVEKRATAFMLPCAGNGGNAECRTRRPRAVAAARK